MDGCMDAWMPKWDARCIGWQIGGTLLGKWNDRQMDGVRRQMDRQIDGWVGGQMSEWMARSQNDFINSFLDWVVQWMDECENGQVDRWMGGWIVG